MKLSIRLLVPTLAIVLVAGAAALLASPSIQAQTPPTCPDNDVCVMSVEFSSTGPYMVGDTIDLTFTFTHKIVAQDIEAPGVSTIMVQVKDPNHPALDNTDDADDVDATTLREFSADNPDEPTLELVFSYTVKGDDPDTADMDEADPHEGVVTLAENALRSGSVNDIETYNDEDDDSDDDLNSRPTLDHDSLSAEGLSNQAIDTTPPSAATSVKVTSSGPYGPDATVEVTATFADAVETSTSTVDMMIGDQPRTARFSSGTRTKMLVFSFEVKNDESGDVRIVGESFGGGEITDLAGNALAEEDRVLNVVSADGSQAVDTAGPIFSYSKPSSLTVGVRIRTIRPKNPDGDAETYKIEGTLPRTLHFNDENGYITGRPTRPVARPTTVTITACDALENCESFTLTIPAVEEAEEDEDVPVAIATLPAVPPVDLSGVSVGDAAPSSGLQLALAATGGALLLGGIGVMAARRRARARVRK